MEYDDIFEKYKEYLMQYSSLEIDATKITTTTAISLFKQALKELHNQYNDELLEMGKRHNDKIELIFDSIEEYETYSNSILLTKKSLEEIKKKVK